MKIKRQYKFLFLGFIISILLYLLPNTVNNLLYTFLIIISGVFLIFAIIALPSQMRQARKSDLVGKGKLIKAKIVKVMTGKSPQHPGGLGRWYSLNPSAYHYVKCEYRSQKDKKTYYFYSWTLFIGPDPTPFLPEKINVWVDPDNWKNYYVDPGILPDDIIRGHAPVINETSRK